MNILKFLAQKILRKELVAYNDRISELTADRDWLTKQCGDLNRDLKRYGERLAKSVRYVVPNSVIAKIIAVLPDPNGIGDNSELKIDKANIIKGEAVKINDKGVFDGWFFEVRFEKLVRISEVKVILQVTLRNNQGMVRLEIPATVGNFSNNGVEIRTWIWNIYESGMSCLPDNVFNVYYHAAKSWSNIKYELGL